MGRTHVRSISLLAIAVVAAACGGGGASAAPAASADGGGNVASAAPAPATAAAASQAGTAPESQAPAASTTTGGGTAAGVCELATSDELASILSVASVTTQVFAGPPDTCAVMGPDGTPIASWVLTAGTGPAIYAALALPGQAVDVPGIGDKAAIVENTGLLVVKGNDLVTIVISGGANVSQDQANEMAKQIGSKIAGRM
jgi:hypothetical protein